MSSNLELVRKWLHQEIAPIANQIDCQPKILQQALQSMGDRNLLALKVPVALGGAGMDELNYRHWQIMMARTSGALTFLQTQHQSAMAMLAKSNNEYLQQEFLGNVIKQNMLIGVGFSHLRRLGKPMMRARETAEGYLFTGKVPWITGYQFFDYFICGATLTDGRELYGVFPFGERSRRKGAHELGEHSSANGKIMISQPMKLIAVTATNTVSAEIDNWFVASQNIVQLKPPGSIHLSSRQNILNHGFLALGCAYAGLDILWQLAEKKQLDFLKETWQSLEWEVKQCYELTISSISSKEIDDLQKLQLRVKAINLAQRCSMAAVIASSGAANDFSSHAGRVYREALLFSVSGQTTEVMEASLKELLNF